MFNIMNNISNMSISAIRYTSIIGISDAMTIAVNISLIRVLPRISLEGEIGLDKNIAKFFLSNAREVGIIEIAGIIPSIIVNMIINVGTKNLVVPGSLILNGKLSNITTSNT